VFLGQNVLRLKKSERIKREAGEGSPGIPSWPLPYASSPQLIFWDCVQAQMDIMLKIDLMPVKGRFVRQYAGSIGHRSFFAVDEFNDKMIAESVAEYIVQRRFRSRADQGDIGYGDLFERFLYLFDIPKHAQHKADQVGVVNHGFPRPYLLVLAAVEP
jgi:hypothetical protein